MSKCIGCGVKLQTNNTDDLGYTTSIDNNLCERCFRIRNYNEYKFVIKDNRDYIDILNNINKTNDLVILVVDLFNITSKLDEIFKYIKNNILLVLTKRDLLPKSCYDEKLLSYFNNYNFIDKLIISSNKNYNLDLLFEKINKYKKSKNVYVVGFTNSGKSTLINKIIYNYTNKNINITTSNLPSTTIDSIEVDIDNSLKLIDTPGLLDDGDISNYIDGKTLKKIIPTKEINPITYQVKGNQSILIDDLLIINTFDNNSLTLYISNKLNINRKYKNIEDNKLLKKEFNIECDNDLVIQGLGFIKITKKCKIIVYVKNNVNIFVRKNLI